MVGRTLDELVRELAGMARVMKPAGASNNWVLAASRTRTGRPLLANDPHMEPVLPSQWYLVHARCPEWSMAGASFVGGPSIVAGHNGHAAWGLTAGLVDNTDLFLEQIGPDGYSVREGEDWVRCEVREETIAVRGAEPVVERILTTRRGPIISPALANGGEALSLRAVWLDPWPIQGLLCAHKGRNFQQFRAYMSQWPALSQNVVYADAGGAIGVQLVGAAPRRRRGWGTYPRPGWEPDAGWLPDLVPFEQMPYQLNPELGFLVTANTEPQPARPDVFLGVDWIDGFRLRAIERALAPRRDWDVAATMALQRDQRSLPWEDMRELVLVVPAANRQMSQALQMLRGWDGRLTVDSQAGSVYELFVAEMVQRTARAKAPRSAQWLLGRSLSVLNAFNYFCLRRAAHLIDLLQKQPAGWFVRSWPEEMADALATVYEQLEQRLGPPGPAWAWGRLRRLVLRHQLGRRGKMLARIFNRGPVPCGGDTDTINQASVPPLDPLGPCNNIASLRIVIDVGAWGNSRFVLPAGQSGNPLSPHYDDQFALWQRGEAVPIAWTEEEVRQATVNTLELTPL
jgi:penicillin amidase